MESGIIMWKDKEVGRVSNLMNDMWYFEGDWLPMDSEHAANFIEMARKLDAKKVMSRFEKGILAFLQFDGSSPESMKILIVCLIDSKIVMRMISDGIAANVASLQSRKRWRWPWWFREPLSGKIDINLLAIFISNTKLLPMSRIMIAVVATLLSLSTYAQTIQLKSKRSPQDLKIINGQYAIYIQEKDVAGAITTIDSAMKTDHSSLLSQVRSHKLTSIDLQSKQATDQELIRLLKENLGALLLFHGKASIYKGETAIGQIFADPSPQVVELDGSSKQTILFTAQGTDDVIFLGDLSTPIEGVK